MTYKKRPDLTEGLSEGESAVELGAGTLIAVACHHLRCTETQCTVLEARARWIDERGITRLDAHDQPVTTRHRHKASHAEIDRHGVDGVTRAALCLVMGEEIPTHKVEGADKPVPIIGFSGEIRDTASILRAIQTAERTFKAVDTASIL